MFFRKKEIIVALSSDEIAEKLWRIKKKSVLFQKIGPDQFRVRINSNRPSLFRTAISGTISGEILPAEEKNTNKIVYCIEPPVIFWVYTLFFLIFIATFFVRTYIAFIEGIQLNTKINLICLFLIILFEVLTFIESLSQTNISEERFLRALAPEIMYGIGDTQWRPLFLWFLII